mgnify:CR=1 FL=1
MKTRIVFFIFILLASFYTFNHFKFKKSNHNIWDLVSSKSSIILELDDPFIQYNKMLKSSIIEKNLTEIKNDFDAFNLFLNNNIESFLNSNKIIISYFKLSDSKLEPIYVTYKGALDIDFIFKKIKESGVGIKERKFNNQIIYESIIEDKNYTFSIIDNIIILSKNSLLIEDAIRTKTNSNLQFIKNESDLFSQVKIKKDIGNLYINHPDIFDLLNIDSKNNLMSFIQKITPKKSFFDMKLEAQILRLNGFSSVSSESFNKDKSRHDSIIDILPYNTISYININSTNEKNFFKFNKKNKIEKFSENYKLEIGRAIIENSKSNKYDELVILKRKSSSDFQKTDSLLYDGIFKLDDQELNELINNKDTQDQKEKFFIKIEDYILISEQISSLIQIENNIKKNKFWTKKLNISKFKNQMNESHNISIVLDYSRFTNTYNSTINMVSFQMSLIDNKLYTSLNMSNKDNVTEEFSNENIVKEFIAKNNLIIKPKIIYSHLDNTPEVITQDEKNNIYHLSKEFNLIWSDSIERINSEIYSIDYYKNNKKQILFSSKNKIYSYDRKGNPLTGFPIKNPSESNIEHLNVIDYDKSKRYRIITSHDNGEIYFLDKNGRKLDGWSPMKMKDQLVQEPLHVRVRGKDYIIILLKNGTLYLKNRKGADYPGFPIKTNNDSNNKIKVEISNSPKNSVIELLSDNGTLYKINFNGEIVLQRDQFRPEKYSKFKMIKDPSGKSSLIFSYDENYIYLYDKRLSFDNINDLKFQYYDLNKNTKYFIITDPKTKKTIFLDKDLSYKLKSVDNENKISLINYSKSINIYKSINNIISMIEIKK